MSMAGTVRGDSIRAYTQDIFAGVDRRVSSCDGAIRDAVNLCSDNYPNLCVRGKRFYKAYDFPILGLCEMGGKFGYVLSGAETEERTETVTVKSEETGEETEQTVNVTVQKDVFYFDGKRIGALKDRYKGKRRQFAVCGNSLCIWPDKVMYKDWREGFTDRKLSAIENYIDGNGGGLSISLNDAYLFTFPDELIAANVLPDELVGLRLKVTGDNIEFYTTILDARYNDNAMLTKQARLIVSNKPDAHNLSAVFCKDALLDIENEIMASVTFRCGESLEGESESHDFIYLRDSKKVSDIDSEKSNFSFFRDGDYIEITGANKLRNNGFYSVDKVMYEAKFTNNWEGQVLVFPLGTFKSDDYEENKLTIRRVIPDIEFICGVNNRIFGVGKMGIYASGLGSPTKWYDYDGISTDSWGVSVTSGGEFTACHVYGDSPLFFKRDRLFKLYGGAPSEYALYEVGCLGVLPGAAGTVCDVSGTLFWLSEKGVCAYTGAFPQVISEELGDADLSRCTVSGTDGRKYYLSDGEKMYVYDTWRGLWSIEDGGAECFTYSDGLLFSIGGRITSHIEREGFTTCEETVENVCEFAPMYFSSPDMKGVSKLRFRCCSEEEAGDEKELEVYIDYDSRGEFELLGSFVPEHFMRTFLIPARPKRCDSYVLRLKSFGRYRLQSITTEFYIGSGAPGYSK